MKRLALVALLCAAACGGAGSLFGDGGTPSDGGNTGGGSGGGAGGSGGGAGGGFMCSTTDSQPGGCAYGEYCSNAMCRDAQVGTCSNFSSTHSTKQWSVTTSSGPVIYEGVDEATDIAADCVAGTPFTVTLKAYVHGAATFPAQKSNLPGFFYVTTTGTENDIPMNYLRPENYTVSADLKNATMKFTLCSTVASTSIQAAFYFTGGNPFCMTLTH